MKFMVNTKERKLFEVEADTHPEACAKVPNSTSSWLKEFTANAKPSMVKRVKAGDYTVL